MTDETNEWGGGLWAAAGLITPMAIRVAATLRLADHIAAGTRTVPALAAAVRADPEALERLMNHLVSAGVLTPSYELTELGDGLRSDHPDGLRAWFDLEGSIGRADLSLVELLHTVRTGEPAFPRFFGRPFWEDLRADPQRAASFDDLMGARLTTSAPAVAAAYPWGTLGHVVDVGGGDGSLLIAVLRAHDNLRGTVVELSGAVPAAEQAIAAAGLTGRADVRGGTFFDPLPAGAGGYLLSGVLHNWNDADARRILRRCAEAGGETGKILVVEAVGGPPDTEGDLRMYSYFGGKERDLGQLGDLAASAGLEVGTVVPAGFRSVVELRHPAA